jgi:hypothetical protein
MRLVFFLIVVLGFGGAALCAEGDYIIYKDANKHCSILERAKASDDKRYNAIGRTHYDSRKEAEIDVRVLCDNQDAEANQPDSAAPEISPEQREELRKQFEQITKELKDEPDTGFIIYKDNDKHCSVVDITSANDDQLNHRVGKTAYPTLDEANIDVRIICDN